MISRGFFGVAVVRGKTEANLGTLFRSAHVFGAQFLAVVGGRYKRQCSDTTNATKHLPLYEFASSEEFFESLPKDCQRVAVELTDSAIPVESFVHPDRAVYIVGPEDGSLHSKILEQCHSTIILPGRWCLNQAVAGSIVMYDRLARASARKARLKVVAA